MCFENIWQYPRSHMLVFIDNCLYNLQDCIGYVPYCQISEKGNLRLILTLSLRGYSHLWQGRHDSRNVKHSNRKWGLALSPHFLLRLTTTFLSSTTSWGPEFKQLEPMGVIPYSNCRECKFPYASQRQLNFLALSTFCKFSHKTGCTM